MLRFFGDNAGLNAVVRCERRRSTLVDMAGVSSDICWKTTSGKICEEATDRFR